MKTGLGFWKASGGGPDTDTRLLLHLDGDLTDASMYAHPMSRTGPGFSYSATAMFGQSLQTVNGNLAYISTPASPNLNFGTGDFTIDFWYQFTSGTTSSNRRFSIGSIGGSTGLYVTVASAASNTYIAAVQSNNTTIKSVSFPTLAGTWRHVAVVRSAGDITIYVDGEALGGGTYAGTVNSTGGCMFWERTNANMTALWDEFRISSVARWTSDFTPPSAPYAG